MSGQPAGMTAGRRPLLRLLWLARPLRGRLVLSVLAGAAATGCGVALLATSGFLLARASQHPSILAISAAVVAVRVFSIGRGVSRYLERLTSHDVAFRVLADIRVAIYRRLERLAPAGLAAFRSGDLLAALISDVDATQDLFIRGIGPPLAAALVGAGAVTVCLLILVPAGGVLALGLLAAGAVAPPLAVAASRRAARATAAARGELSAAVTDLLSGAADLHAFGAQDTALAAAAEADRKLTAQARRHAAATGLGSGLISALTGLTVWGVLVLGVAAVGHGTLTRVPLAVLTLTALASFEAVTLMPAAALALGSARASARRIGAILDAPDPVADPPAPRPLPAGPVHVRLSGVQVRYEPDGPLALDGLDLDLPPGRRVALIGPSGAGKSTVAAVLLRFLDPVGGSITLNGAGLASYAADTGPDHHRRVPARSAHLQRQHPRQPETGPARRHQRRTGRRRRGGPASALDPVAARGLGHPGRRARRGHLRRRTAAARAGPRPARGSGRADPRRTHRAPRSRSPRCPDRRPARPDRRPRHPAHYARAGGTRPGRRDHRPRPRQSCPARHA